MQRIKAVDPSSATRSVKELLDRARAKFGMVPRMLRTLAASPAALRAYLDFEDALEEGSIGVQLREQIALRVCETTGSVYCRSAHAVIAKAIGLSDERVRDSRAGSSPDRATEAALKFARLVVVRHGRIDDGEFARLVSAGFDDGQIAEIVAQVALTFFGNTFNSVARTEPDFPAGAATRSDHGEEE